VQESTFTEDQSNIYTLPPISWPAGFLVIVQDAVAAEPPTVLEQELEEVPPTSEVAVTETVFTPVSLYLFVTDAPVPLAGNPPAIVHEYAYEPRGKAEVTFEFQTTF
jgi:hypothetical protein